ncbi:GAP family protein [Streptomyces sp. NBC_01381]|uniref:GAP family protein n=1 Tax=Streptomyces sp. NBC_01381 TaxID=2903845 RepID=UPI002252BE47|nr:GAP family protein [Streptomyces sp. NBC_01381]MCX4673502.1 GAP family protein [Streptomyces sp. NBC_01381]
MDVLRQILPLALLDTLSVSTLAIPVWFLLTPRGLRIANVFCYLLLVGAGYLLLGVLLMGVLSAVRDPMRSALDSPAGDVVTAVAGAAFLLLAAWHGFLRRPASGEGRLIRWRASAVGESATLRGVAAVSLIAVVLETATMFPYLSAIDTLGREERPLGLRIGLLALYCLVMIAPALLATLLRVIAKHAVQPVLRRLDRWLRDNAQENTAWLFAIAGFMLLSNSDLFQRLLAQLSDQ